MAVLNDRTQGGSSLTDGALELMLHRRLLYKGHGGNLIINEPGVDGKGLVVRGKHYVFFGPISQSAQLYRNQSESVFMSPIVSFEPYITRQEYASKRVTSYSSLSDSMPESVHFLTLENWRPNQVLVRLEHMYESSDNNSLSKGVDINLGNIFKGFKVLDSQEMNLAANELLSKTQRLKWSSHYMTENAIKRDKRASNLTVHLSPQQIRTFILTVEDNIHKEGLNCFFYTNLNVYKDF